MSEQVSASGPMYRPSRDDYAGEAGDNRRMYIVAAAGAFVVLTGLGVYSMMGRHGGGPVPVVSADTAPFRIKAKEPDVAPARQDGDPNKTSLAPAAEEPNFTALAAAAGPRVRHAPVAMVPVPPAPALRPVVVQLGTARSEATAKAAWDKLAKQMPGLFGVLRPTVQKTADATTWRLRTSGFADPAQARVFCGHVKAKGHTCALVDS